jgi:hypothetical protein
MRQQVSLSPLPLSRPDGPKVAAKATSIAWRRDLLRWAFGHHLPGLQPAVAAFERTCRHRKEVSAMSIVTSKGSGTVEALSDELRRFAEEVEAGRA